MSKPVAALLWILAGIASALLALELLLRILPVSGKGTYGAEVDPNWPMHHLLPNSSFTYSAGWNLDNVQQGHINNMGYVAPFDYVAGSPGIVVIGDSYIESLMNEYSQTLQGRLGGLLDASVDKGAAVMEFANSGGSMPDYLAVAGLVAGRFKPTWGVVVISEGDFVEGFSPNHGYHNWDPAANPPVKLIGADQERSELAKWARRLALIRYVRYNLKVDLSRLIHAEPVLPKAQVVRECEPVELSPDDTKLASAFVELLPKQFGLDPSRIVLVFDSNRKLLYDPAGRSDLRCPSRDSVAQKLIHESAKERGMHVVDTGPIFAEYYARTHRRVDHSPVDWHWNSTAHELVANEVAAVMNEASRAR